MSPFSVRASLATVRHDQAAAGPTESVGPRSGQRRSALTWHPGPSVSMADGKASGRRRLLFFVTEDWYFVSHRLPLAVAARQAGYDVAVVTRVRQHGETIASAGLRVVPFEIARGGTNPLRELATLGRLVGIYRRERPDIVHHVAIKPVIYGSVAAWIACVPETVNAIAGMGLLLAPRGTRGLPRWVAYLLRRAMGMLLRRGAVIVQNRDDEGVVLGMGVDPSKLRRIPGSGVDLQRFSPVPEAATDAPTVVLPARLLWNKGVGEFVEAARILRGRGSHARFVLAGQPDTANPVAVPADRIRAWVDQGLVVHLGWVDDVPSLLADTTIVCLPSYREGIPKSLIEAAASGLPIVTTDVPGCREIVRHEYNGLLVPPRDPEALAAAIESLLENPERREEFGRRGREMAEAEFGERQIVEQTLAVYAGHRA